MNENGTFRADLHCHSTYSDGTFTPHELVKHALNSGLNGLAITDHDNVDAYGCAKPLADALGLMMITGVEFSAVHKGSSVHILGYGFKADSICIRELCSKHAERRLERNAAILHNLEKLGMPLLQEDLKEFSSNESTLGRPHIAQAMIKKGYVLTLQEAFKNYLGEGQAAFERGDSISVEETIQVIHKGGGVAVIAHPHLLKNQHLEHDLLEMPFDGIEAYYSSMPCYQHQRWIKIAKKKHWLITGGSDFHGAIKPAISLGCSWVPYETFCILSSL